MAKREENQTGRMLFTDFDALGKGRPVAALDAFSPQNNALRDDDFVNIALPTIRDLASRLELDFEDDPGEENSGKKRGFFDDEEEKRADEGKTGGESPPEPESDDIQPDEPASIASPWPWSGGHVPTWEEYADSLHSDQGARHKRRRRRLDYAPADEHGIDETGKDVPESSGNLTEEPEDYDILSAISSENEDEEEEWRGQRLGVAPPRAIPYGGIKRLDEWYRPPEQQPESELRTERVEEWYEPPETEYMPGDAPADDVDLSDLFELLENQPTEEGTSTNSSEVSGSPPETPHATGGSAPVVAAETNETTGIADFFSGIDVDSLWREKVEKKAAKPSSRLSASDPFSNQPESNDRPGNAEPPSGRTARPSGGKRGESMRSAKSTLILNPRALDNAQTTILNQDTVGRAQAPVPDSPHTDYAATPHWEETRYSARQGRETKTAASDDDVLDFLDDIDSMAADGPDSSVAAPFSDGHFPLAGLAELISDAGVRDAPLPDETFDDFNLDELIAEADAQTVATRHNVAAPVIGDDAIAEVKGGKDDLLADDLPGTAGNSPAPDTDTVEYDAFPVPADTSHIKPPAINDSDLHVVEKRSGTEEMQAMFGDENGEKAEAYDAETAPESGAAANEEQEEGEPQAAVDPMDVFANMDDMDFSGDSLDDDMKAMLEDDKAEAEEAVETPLSPAADAGPPADIKGKILYYARMVAARALPQNVIRKVTAMVAWRENWWFYYDLLAAVIASASLAVIISYYVWYR